MEFNLLTKKQVNNMSIFKDYGKQAVITDYAKALGGTNSKEYGAYYLKKPTVNISSVLETGAKLYIDANGEYKHFHDSVEVGIRPAVFYNELFDLNGNIEIVNGKIISGEYPQTRVDEELEIELNRSIRGRDIFETGKTYTALSGNFGIPMQMTEYRYKGNKYAEIDYHFEHGWFKVEPITWLVDMETGIAVSEKILVASVKYNDSYKEKMIESYNNSNIKKYLDECFSKEIYISDIPKAEIERSEANRLKSLKDIKYDITSEMLKLELLEVKIKTEIFVRHIPLTIEVQETLSKIKEQEKRLELELKEVELQIEDCTNENVVDGKIKIKRIS